MVGFSVSALAMLFPLVALAIILTFVLVMVKIIRGTASQSTGDKASVADEAKMIQQIYQGLARMEERVEALETLMLDSERKDR